MEQAGIYGRQSMNKAKSIADQIGEAQLVCTEHGWTVAETYQDGVSASRYARKARDDWQRCLDDIRAGRFSILVLWESSRGDRTLTTWSGMLDLCRERGVRIYVITHDRLYDPRNHRDWKTLAEDGIASAVESDLISVRVRRGHASAAAAGRPVSFAPYGYRRVYDPQSGALVGQEPDGNAEHVRWIVGEVAKGRPLVDITRDLNARGVPAPGRSSSWVRQRVRWVAMNPCYAGVRVHRDKQYPGTWPAIVSPELAAAARRVLEDPARRTTRPGRQRHLLSYLARCATCDAVLSVNQGAYRCTNGGCVSANQAGTDDVVVEQVMAWLARPSVLSSLRTAEDGADAQSAAASAQLLTLEQRLAEVRKSAALGRTSLESLAVIEAELTAQIRALDGRTKRAALPEALRRLLEPGEDVRTRWSAMPVPARRDVIRALAVVVVSPAELLGPVAFDPWRLAGSRWVGDDLTWGERWSA